MPSRLERALRSGKLNPRVSALIGRHDLATYALMGRRLGRLAHYHRGRDDDFSADLWGNVGRTLRYAATHSPYYRDLFTSTGVDPSQDPRTVLRALPTMDKAAVRENAERMLTVDPERYGLHLRTTGGSTGEPLGFYGLAGQDPAHQAFLYRLMGYSRGDRILSMDGAIVPDERRARGEFWVRKSSSELPYGSMSLSSQYLREVGPDGYVDFLQSFRPAIIRGYPSFIDLIAQYLMESGRSLGFALKGVQVTSESHSDAQVQRIEAGFGCPVYDQYGHTESCIFGYSTGDGKGIYCSPFYGYVEVLDEAGDPVPVGEVGEVVATAFHNLVMPFIRYRTGDMAEYGGDEDGIVRLRRVLGRTQDFLYDSARRPVLLTALIFAAHYRAFDHIRKWQLVQTVPGEVLIRIIRGSDYTDEDEAELRHTFHGQGAITAVFEYVDQLPLTPAGKSKLLIRDVAECQ